MSTILDALRKLQRERAAQSPPRDLRGSVTNETPSSPARRRRSRSRWLAPLALLLAVGAAGYGLYYSGKLDSWLAPADDGEIVMTDAEIAEAERETRELEAARAQEPPANTAPEPPPPAPADNPEIAAERARLEAALVNARAAQEAQRQAELTRAAQAASAAANPPPPEPVAQAEPPPPAPKTRPKAVARKTAAPRPSAPEPATPTKPEAEPVAKSSPETAVASAFPDVQVLSIRWHPNPERRMASLRLERQNAPEAREGDIIAGVLVYRIDPGAVELRVGSARRSVSPGP